MKPTVVTEQYDYISHEVAVDTIEYLKASNGESRPWIYWIVLLYVFLGVGICLALKIDISVQAPGLVRSTTEKVVIRPMVGGAIRTINAREGLLVNTGDVLLTIDSSDVDERLRRVDQQILDSEPIVDDIAAMCQTASGFRADGTIKISSPDLFSLKSLVKRQEWQQFILQMKSLLNSVSNTEARFERIAQLAGKGLVSNQEIESIRFDLMKGKTEVFLALESTLARWQSELRQNQILLTDLRSQQSRLRKERENYSIVAPVSGVVMGFRGMLANRVVVDGETLGFVSPDDLLIAEAFVEPRNVAFIKLGQKVKLQIDAFPYTEWGFASGNVLQISDDIVDAGDGRSVFKVLVSLKDGGLLASSGRKAQLRKGLTFTARFALGRRSIHQIIYQKMSELLDPNTLSTNAL